MPTSYCCCCSKRPLGEQGPTGTVSEKGGICRSRGGRLQAEAGREQSRKRTPGELER